MIVIFLAEGFEEIEAIATADILRRAGLDVRTAGVGGRTVRGAHEISIVCDVQDDEIHPDETLEAVVLPGGMPGTANLEHADTVQMFLRFAQRHDLLIAAICAAPSILGHGGYLKNHKAVCFPGYEQELSGAEIGRESVCRSGNIITAKGAGVTIDFGTAIAGFFVGEAHAKKICASMQCRL